MSERTERWGGMRHATVAGVPRGGPARLRQAARLAAVRDALGDALGPHLAGLSERPDGVVLRLAGDGWERGLATQLEALAGPVARALGAPLRPVTVESVPGGAGPVGPAGPVPRAPDGAPQGPLDPEERRRRLAVAAERLLARPGGGASRGKRSSVDSGPGGQ